MADGKKISELTKLSNLADADEFVVVNKDVTSGDESGIGGQTSRITFSDLKSEIGTQGPQGPGVETEQPVKVLMIYGLKQEILDQLLSFWNL